MVARRYPLVLDELIREAFKQAIHEAENELNAVDKAFLVVHAQMVKEGHGFGVNYWGESWRFKMFDVSCLFFWQLNEDVVYLLREQTSRYVFREEGRHSWIHYTSKTKCAIPDVIA